MAKTLPYDPLMNQIDGEGVFPYRYEDLEKAAAAALAPEAFGYIRSGAGGEETLRNNRKALEEIAIIPRMLRSVETIDLQVNLFGHTYAAPVLLAPIGMQKLSHPDAELATVRAASKHGVPMIVSTASTYSLEDIADAAPQHPKWFQLYWSDKNPQVSLNMAKRAEQAGYDAIVVTVDTVMLGWRETDLANQFSPLKKGYGMGNYRNDDVFMSIVGSDDHDAILNEIVRNFFHPSLNWKSIEQLKQVTKLPVLIKGLLHPDDARLAIEYGADGIIVSNHGGRQLDGVIGAAEALPLIAEQVKGQIPVLMDSGIRRGVDVVKALALGADAVCIGRPFAYGLAAGGEAGVSKVLERFLDDVRASFGLAGAPDVPSAKALETRRNR